MPEELAAPVTPKHLIPGLDALRVYAVSLVLAFHFGLATSGSFGVIIFFVLSGFLITGILANELEKTRTISFTRFYSRRAFRIFPTFYACWALTLVLALVHHQTFDWRAAFGTFFYAADYMRAARTLAHQSDFPMWISWSLAIEEQFYFLWPAVLLFAYRRRQGLAWPVLLVAAVWAWRVILHYAFHVSDNYLYNAFDTRVDALMVGGVLALLVRSKGAETALDLLRRSKWQTLPVLALIAACSSISFEAHVYRPEFLFLVEPLLVGILLVQVVHWAANGWGFLEHASIKFVARLSYALYLYHIVALNEAHRLFSGHWSTLQLWERFSCRWSATTPSSSR